MLHCVSVISRITKVSTKVTYNHETKVHLALYNKIINKEIGFVNKKPTPNYVNTQSDSKAELNLLILITHPIFQLLGLYYRNIFFSYLILLTAFSKLYTLRNRDKISSTEVLKKKRSLSRYYSKMSAVIELY